MLDKTFDPKTAEPRLYEAWEKSGAFSPDAVVKRDIFQHEIAGSYHVIGVFDDRQHVVRMWRDLGLTVFQVAEGDF